MCDIVLLANNQALFFWVDEEILDVVVMSGVVSLKNTKSQVTTRQKKYILVTGIRHIKTVVHRIRKHVGWDGIKMGLCLKHGDGSRAVLLICLEDVITNGIVSLL